MLHIPVLFNEVMMYLKKDNSTLLDCTLGYAGHSLGFLKQNKNAKLVACDQDDMAIEHSSKVLDGYDAKIYKCNYKDIFDYYTGEPDFILADIGVSSVQLDFDERGFSLKSNSLDMRMDKNNPLDAKTYINECSLDELESILKDYAQLPHSHKIAQKIINARHKSAINSSKELYEIIGNEKLHGRNVLVATLVFQAIRIHINKELDVLKEFLDKCEKKRFKNTKLLIITFHSLEDKIVKEYFKKWEKNCICDSNAIRCTCSKNHALGKIITKKPIVPTKEEIKLNSRSAPSKLRVFGFGDV